MLVDISIFKKKMAEKPSLLKMKGFEMYFFICEKYSYWMKPQN